MMIYQEHFRPGLGSGPGVRVIGRVIGRVEGESDPDPDPDPDTPTLTLTHTLTWTPLSPLSHLMQGLDLDVRPRSHPGRPQDLWRVKEDATDRDE